MTTMQTTYSATGQGRVSAGWPADNGPKDYLSRYNGNASAEIPFGIGVIFGSADQAVKTPGAVTDKIVGIAMGSMNYQPGGVTGQFTLGSTGIVALADVNVCRKGRVYLLSEENVVPGDRLHCRAVSGSGGTVLGKFRKSRVASETIDCTNQIVVLETATAGNPFAAEVDFTSQSIQGQVAELIVALTAADGSGTAATLKSTLLTQLGLLV
jgi:hypothetical protein